MSSMTSLRTRMRVSSSWMRATKRRRAVGVNIEGHLNLGNSSGGWRNSSQIELAKVVVVLGHGPLTLVHLDGDSRLVVGVGGEGLGLLGGDGGVPLDQRGHHATSSLNSKREGRNIE